MVYVCLCLFACFCREELHQQEQRTAQLKQLMQKTALLKLALNAYYMGRCTYTQVRPSQKGVAVIHHTSQYAEACST